MIYPKKGQSPEQMGRQRIRISHDLLSNSGAVTDKGVSAPPLLSLLRRQ